MWWDGVLVVGLNVVKFSEAEGIYCRYWKLGTIDY